MTPPDIKTCQNLSVEQRSQAYTRLAGEPRFAANLVDQLASDPQSEIIASWFLKHHLENGAILDPVQVDSVFAAAGGLKHWEAILHVLQCFPYMTITESVRDTVERFLRASLEHENKFVRAWAYGGFNQLADAFPQYGAEARRLLDYALRNEAPSVKARIRKIDRGQH